MRGPHPIRAAVKEATRRGHSYGYEGRPLATFVELVNPGLPGSPEERAWKRWRLRIAGPLRRSRSGAAREYQVMLDLFSGGDDQ